MLAALVLLFAAETLSYRASYRGAYEASAQSRAAFAEHLRKLPLGYLDSRDPEELGSMMMGDLMQLEGAMAQTAGQLVGGIVASALVFVGFLFLDWRMAAATFAALPTTGLLLWLTSGLERRMSKGHLDSKVEMANRFGEYVAGMRAIRSYRLQGKGFERLERAVGALMRNSIRIEGALGPLYLTAVALTKSGLALIAVTGVYLILGGTLSVPLFALFLFVGTRVFDPLAGALMRLAEWRRAVLSGERVMAVMDEPAMTGEEGVADAPPAARAPDTVPASPAPALTFERVSFGYGDRPVLSDLSFSLAVGSLTAIVGASGSGKSTVLKLIARFYDPQGGRVCLGGVDARTMEPERLLQNISMVFQDVYLFQDSIGNNIRYGRQDATREEVEAAAKAACCHGFISALPNGYDTAVGEGGTTLSGGERQRVSIARAILKDAPVILLDEATASLDPENEADVQRAIGALVEGRTIVTVAHRLKTVAQADLIIVLDKGRIAEQGRHEDLYAASGLYTRLWDLQQASSGWVIQ
jgi:ATP-binding cassette subfamily B protein